MSQKKSRLFQAARIGGLAMLFLGQITGFTAMGADLKPKQVLHSHTPPSNLAGALMSIAEADANTIETWLIGDLNKVYFGVGNIFHHRMKLVLAQPNAKVELTKIMARQDLPPRLRVYAQEMLIDAGQLANPTLVEVYCQTMESSVKGQLYYDLWGFPGLGTSTFGSTLVGYGQAALPCLSRLLDNNNELYYGGSELGASSRGMQYRVSDLAAYFITHILNLPYNKDQDPDPTVRDRDIQALRQRLMASPNGVGK